MTSTTTAAVVGSTGKRSKAASRVFGEALFHDRTMADTSLCYSASSGGSDRSETDTSRNDSSRRSGGNILNDTTISSSTIPEEETGENAEPTVLFVTNHDGGISNASSSPSSAVNEPRSLGCSGGSSETAGGVTATKDADISSFSIDGQENNPNYSRLAPSLSSAVSTKNPFASATGMEKIRHEELSRLRATKRSPMREQMMKKTEEAIRIATANVSTTLLPSFRTDESYQDNVAGTKNITNSDVSGSTTRTNNTDSLTANNSTNTSKHSTKTKNANMWNKNSTAVVGGSINNTLNASRKAKSSIIRVKSRAVKSVRFQWQQENTETKLLNEKVEENRRQIRMIQKNLTSSHFREKARKDEAKKFERLAKLEDEYVFKSNVYSDHQKRLKAERDQRRRQSTDARARVRRNKQEGSEKLRLMKIEEEQANFEVSADLHRARGEAARANTEARRKSFQFRAGDARKIRTMRENWHEQELHVQHEGFELKRAAAKDVEKYKHQMKMEDIEDKRSRNLEARQRRQREEEDAHEAMIAEHRSYGLKWDGERDAEAYKKKMKEERRKSLERRNKESVRHAKVMEELQSLANEKETEDYVLKWGGENDVKAHLARMAEERRKSLQQRAIEARKARQIGEEEHAKAVQASLEDMMLQSDCQKDVENYKAECAERDRKSLQYRGKQLQLQHLEEEKRRNEQLRKDEESSKLETLARKDVEEYYKDCQKRRRKSLAWRAKERRRNFEWKRKKTELEVKERSHTSYLQSLDLKHMALAQEEERAKKAMDALRSAGCTFHGNPFLNL